MRYATLKPAIRRLARGAAFLLAVWLGLTAQLSLPGQAAVPAIGHADSLFPPQDGRSLKFNAGGRHDGYRGRGDWTRGNGYGGRHWDRDRGRGYWNRGNGGYWHRGHRGGRYGWWWIVGPRWYWGPGPGYAQPRPIVIIPPAPVWQQQQPAAPAAYCREYQGNATIDGSNQPFYGTACLQPDGSWRIVN